MVDFGFFKSITVLIIFWVVIYTLLTSQENDENTYIRKIDCKQNPQVCEKLEEAQYEQNQYEDFDWARPY